MATRSLTRRFEQLRSQRRSRRSDTGRNYAYSDADRNGSLLANDDVAISVGLGHSLPPEWVDIVEQIQKDVSRIKNNIGTLQNLHNQRLKVSFGQDEAEQERDIEILTQEITRLLKKCESSLKRIATIGNERGASLSKQERMVRLNVMRALATELQSLSKNFRHCQKDFLTRLRGQEEVGNEFFVDDSDSKQPLSLDEALERGMSDQQIQQLHEIEQNSDEREKEIIRIAQSINDLASIFQELSVLVIEQGTVLDRIDYNIEQTLVKVKQGTQELVKADEYSKKARTIKCIIALLIIVIIESLILAFKNKDDS